MKHIFVVKSHDLKAIKTIAKVARGTDHLVLKSDYPGQIRAMIAPYCANENRIYVLGGDGMIHNAIQAMANQKAQLAIVPRGTGNDFARNFVIAKDLETNIRSCMEQEAVAVDLILANDIYVANTLCFGIDSDCANHVHDQRIIRFLPGGLFYAKMTLQRLFSFTGFKATIDDECCHVTGKFVLGVVANGRYYGGGYQIAAGQVGDGLFEIGYLKGDSKIKAALKLLKLASNRILKDPCYHCSNHRSVTIETTGLVNIDGETYPAGRYSLDVQVGALRVLNPIKKPN